MTGVTISVSSISAADDDANNTNKKEICQSCTHYQFQKWNNQYISR